MRAYWLAVMFVVSTIYGCKSVDDTGTSPVMENDTIAVAMMQGVWLDDLSGVQKLMVRGDSIYFPNRIDYPLFFKVISDTLFVHGGELAKYPIESMSETDMSFYTASGDLMSLRKSETDSLLYGMLEQAEEPKHEVLEKDSIIFNQGVRYRGYVYINETDIKVTSPYISEDGIYMDNVFFDNVIHICVYKGKERLFGKDIRREMFEGIVPQEYLQFSILEDMNFIGVSSQGYTYSATVCSPGSPSCYCVEVFVSKDGELTFTLVGS